MLPLILDIADRTLIAVGMSVKRSTMGLDNAGMGKVNFARAVGDA